MSETSSGDVPNTETSTKSEKKLRILIPPESLPEPIAPPAKIPETREMTDDARYRIHDYFWEKYTAGEKRARERKWI